MISKRDWFPRVALLCGTLVGGIIPFGLRATDCFAQRLTLASATAQDKQVKVYGVGGPRGLEAYQSGVLISGDGHILTVWSYVLDTENVTVVLHDGRRLTGKFVGADPRLEIAVLKVDVTDSPFYDLTEAVELSVGDRVLAFSNMYGIASGTEASSMLQGFVSAISELSARRGTYKTPYDGRVYIVDAITNNAGAAGGILTDYRGRIAGLLGKEIRNTRDDLWLNYAIPIEALRDSVADILAGKTRPRAEQGRRRPDEYVTLDMLGMVLLPDILPKTPPYVQHVIAGSPASSAGIQPDDLVVIVGEAVVQSRRQLVDELSFMDQLDPVPITLMRGTELVTVELVPSRNN